VAGRLAAQQQVVAARQQLALAAGLRPEDMATPADPAEDLPEVIGPVATNPASVRRYIELALSRRADYLAARKRVDAENKLLAQSNIRMRPPAELTLSTGYSGLREGVYPWSYLASSIYGVHGPDAVAGVRYEFTPRNNAAAGRLAQTEASIRRPSCAQPTRLEASPPRW
jgi:hypothetical protein